MPGQAEVAQFPPAIVIFHVTGACCCQKVAHKCNNWAAFNDTYAVDAVVVGQPSRKMPNHWGLLVGDVSPPAKGCSNNCCGGFVVVCGVDWLDLCEAVLGHFVILVSHEGLSHLAQWLKFC